MSSSNSWAVWLVIILFLLTCIGIIIWFAIDSNIPKKPQTYQGQSPNTTARAYM